ncbi:MAG: hypothetical protein OQJ76_04045, partial [Rhodospirillales bacterium]|nr:hypothetical protein [Rhodospirillales bacterium]
VIDQNISFGKGGILHAEVASVLYGQPDAPMLVSFIGGLGGRDISAGEFAGMADIAEEAAKTGVAPPPRLLFTGDELRQVRKFQAVAALAGAEAKGDSGHE